MTLVRLIVTGLAEQLGLGSFLAKIFPDPISILKGTGNSIFQLVPGKDLEDFESSDAGYLQKHSNLPKNVPPIPIRSKTQEWFAKHPKEYVKHLSAHPQTGVVAYREAIQGVAALKELNPKQALSIATQRQFLRSLVYDLADALNQPLPPAYHGDCHPETSRQGQRNRILRNI